MGSKIKMSLRATTLVLAATLLSAGVSATSRSEGLAAPAAKPREAGAASAAKPDASGCGRAGFRVLLDVGHSAQVPGATSARGVPEYDFNLRLGQAIEKALVRAGFRSTSLLITPGPARAGLFARVERANTWPADLVISVHHDSVPEWFLETWTHGGREARFSDRFAGHSVFVSSANGEAQASLLFAQLLGRELKLQGLRFTPHYTRPDMDWRRRELLDPETGVYRYDQLVVLRDTKVPTVLFEAGSIINRDEELLMSSPERQGKIAAAVTDAVRLFCAARAQ
jgi:N-acetylmuramoyl-L-alanine amidase